MPYARRVQRVGSGTLTVSLPRRWVEKTGLKPGDVVSIVEVSDNVLKLETKPSKTPEHTLFTLDAGKIKDKKLLGRLLIGAYLQGFEEIHIICGDGLTEEMQEVLTATVDSLPGVEIVEQSYRKVVVQTFLDPNKFPVLGIIKRMQVMLTVGMNNLADILKDVKKDLHHEIERMESKIDELYFLCIRQIFFNVKREVWGEEAADPYIQAIGDRLVVRALEEIADSIKLASDEAVRLAESNISKTTINKLLKQLEAIQVIFGKTMKAFFSLDISLADEVIETTTRQYGEEMVFNDVFPQSGDVALTMAIRNYIYNLVNIARNCKIIAEVTLNRFVRTPSKLITVEKVSS